jgi:SNF2 family DNA or RNA helicase
MPLLSALRLAQGDGDNPHTLSIGGLTATGWVKELLESTSDSESLPDIPQPPKFEGQRRPYQLTGLRWMAFLSKFGIGTCLADDMGLGKTIQALAVLVDRAKDGPAMVIAPASVCRNWLRETEKFAPTLNPILFGQISKL